LGKSSHTNDERLGTSQHKLGLSTVAVYHDAFNGAFSESSSDKGIGIA